MDTVEILCIVVPNALLLFAIAQKICCPYSCGTRPNLQKYIEEDQLDEEQPLVEKTAINYHEIDKEKGIKGLFDNGAFYGFDGTWIYHRFSFLIVLFLVVGFFCYYVMDNNDGEEILKTALNSFVTLGFSLLFLACTTLYFKVLNNETHLMDQIFMRKAMLKELNLQGDENVLDVACGRGFILNGIASQLTPGQGKVTGIDIFDESIQSGNSRTTTLRNIARMNNLDRVEVKYGLAQDLSQFPDNSFDCITVSLMIPYLSSEDRRKAFDEFRRVLKPDGIFVSADVVMAIHNIRGALEEAGFVNIATRFPLFYLFFPVFVNTGRKPMDQSEEPVRKKSWKSWALLPGQFLAIIPWAPVYFVVGLIPITELIQFLP